MAEKIVLGIFILAFVVFPIGYCTAYLQSYEKEMIEVSEKTMAAGSGQQYLIFSESGEVYENSDSFAYWKFDSSDIHARIDSGKCYEAGLAGWRVHFLSWYRNIIDLQEVPCDS